MCGGREYNCLYWEDRTVIGDYMLRQGFCVRGEDTAEFLEKALTGLGLTQKEQDDFITYWLSQMVNSSYNVIEFNPAFYRENYELTSSRKIDDLITVYMAFRSSDKYVDIRRRSSRE